MSCNISGGGVGSTYLANDIIPSSTPLPAIVLQEIFAYLHNFITQLSVFPDATPLPPPLRPFARAGRECRDRQRPRTENARH